MAPVRLKEAMAKVIARMLDSLAANAVVMMLWKAPNNACGHIPFQNQQFTGNA
jgi:hypothetical protein